MPRKEPVAVRGYDALFRELQAGKVLVLRMRAFWIDALDGSPGVQIQRHLGTRLIEAGLLRPSTRRVAFHERAWELPPSDYSTFHQWALDLKHGCLSAASTRQREANLRILEKREHVDNQWTRIDDEDDSV